VALCGSTSLDSFRYFIESGEVTDVASVMACPALVDVPEEVRRCVFPRPTALMGSAWHSLLTPMTGVKFLKDQSRSYFRTGEHEHLCGASPASSAIIGDSVDG